MKILISLILLSFFGDKIVICAPVNAFTRRNDLHTNFDADKLITFMQAFGYLNSPSESASEGLIAESLYAEDAISEGIKNVQKFGGLNPTGVIDDNTLKLLTSPRCGVKDIQNEHERRKRYIVGSKNWKKRKITYFIANWSPKVNETEMASALEKAFNAWSLYSRLVFKRVNDSSADIIIAFGSYYHGDRYPFDGVGNILAHAFYPYEENAFGGDIHFDNDENWKEGSSNLNEGVDFLSVAVHELGHSLGLAHSPVYNAIMFPYYKGATPAQLDYDDILGMYQLYIQSTLEENASLEDTSIQPDEVTSASNVDDSTKIEETTVKITESSEDNDENSVESESNEVDEDFLPNAREIFCFGSFDAMGIINNELLIIKSNHVWKFNSKFELLNQNPMKISKIFPNLPLRFKKIDAFCQSSESSEINIFSGNEYITYDVRGPIFNAYNLSRYTNDPDIEKIDSAMVWTKNNKTYLFSNDRFWRFSDDRRMDPFYPRIIKRWRGVPKNLNGVISFQNGPTVFFKNDEFITYDDVNVRPLDESPRKIHELFDYCR